MKRLLAIFLLVCAGALVAAPTALECARAALRDEMWSCAETNAVVAETTAVDAATRLTARRVQLEALAGAQRTSDMLARLDSWKDATNENFRYWRAWAHARAGHTNEVVQILAQTFSDAELAQRAQRLKAWTAYAAGDRAAAERAFKKASELLKQQPAAQAENACDWARVLDAAGDPAAALKVLNEEGAIKCRGPQGDLACLLAAELATKAGVIPLATDYYDSLVRNTNTVAEAFVPAACQRSEQLLADGQTHAALRVASNAVLRARASQRFGFRAGVALGFALLATPSTRAEGHAQITACVNQYSGDPASGTVQCRLADTLLLLGDAKGALKEYGVLLESFPTVANPAHVQEGQGWAALRLGQYTRAEGFFAQAAKATSDADLRARCLFKQADAQMAEGRFADAAVTYGRIEHTNLIERAHFHRADALARAGQAAEAEKMYRALFGQAGALAVESGLRAAALVAGERRSDDAVELYGRILNEKATRKPTVEQRVRALAGRGRVFYNTYEFDKAKADFDEAAKLNTDQSDRMRFMSIICLYGNKRDHEAVSAATHLLATATDPALVSDLQIWLAKYQARTRNWSAAVTNFLVCATNEQNTSAERVESLVRAARCATELSDFPQVVELVGRAVTNEVAVAACTNETPVSSWVAEGRVLQGKALVELGRIDEALRVFEQAQKVPAGTTARRRAQLAYADCLLAGGADDASRYTAALKAYSSLALESDLSPSLRLMVAFMSARTLEKLNRKAEAMDKYYSDVVLAYSDSVRSEVDEGRRNWYDPNARALFARAVFTLADYYESRGQVKAAENVLKHLLNTGAEEQDVARRRLMRLREKGDR